MVGAPHCWGSGIVSGVRASRLADMDGLFVS
jgi:hypothetical protein